MLTKEEFSSVLSANGTLILDGALATELETRGHDLNHALWSAKVLKDDPASIEQIHLDYFLAGADCVITASYQASIPGLVQHFDYSEQESKDLISRSVEIAKQARTTAYSSGVDAKRKLLIAGSIGPYGAFLADGSEYRGDYQKSVKELQDFHRPRIQALIDAGVDLLALETMPNIVEIKALLDLLHAEFPSAISFLGCTVRDATHLSDGTPLVSVLTLVEENDLQVIAVGINCVPLSIVPDALSHLSMLNLSLTTQIPLLCYPNSGETWDATTKTWHDSSNGKVLTDTSDRAQADHSHADSWIRSGARLIGGCCRTGPAFISNISERVRSINV